VAAQGERQVDALRPHRAPLVVESCRRSAGIALECDIRQCIAPPKAERPIESVQRLVEVAGGNRRARSCHEIGEADGVQLAGVAFDCVAGRAGGDHRCVAKDGTEPRDVLMHHVPGAHRRRFTPDGIDQLVDGNDLADAQQQDGEQRSLAATRQVHAATVDQDLELPEDTEADVVHGRNEDYTATTRLPAAGSSTCPDVD
jgi:hypothetical protein